MTRARARQINDQVLSLLCTYDLTNKNIILHSCLDLLVLRNKGKIKEGSDQMEQRSCMHVTRPIHQACHVRMHEVHQDKRLGLMAQHYHVGGP